MEPLVCQRMINDLGHHFERHCRHVGTNATFDDVNGMSNAGREYFGFPIIVVIDFDDVADDFQTVLFVSQRRLNFSGSQTRSGCHYLSSRKVSAIKFVAQTREGESA